MAGSLPHPIQRLYLKQGEHQVGVLDEVSGRQWDSPLTVQVECRELPNAETEPPHGEAEGQWGPCG